MIVCICKNISDKTIRQTASRGSDSMSALREELGLGTCCGKCVGCARQVLRDVKNQESAVNPLFTLVPAVLGGIA